MSRLHYNSDDALCRSPSLQPVRPKSTPSPEPPPFIPQQAAVPPRRRRRRERNTQPSQGDTVLMNFVGPDHPDIASIAGQSPLNSASESEASDSEDNKAFKEAESPNTIDDVFNSNQEESGNCIAVDMEPKSNTAQDVDCPSTRQMLRVNAQLDVQTDKAEAKAHQGKKRGKQHTSFKYSGEWNTEHMRKRTCRRHGMML